VACHGEFHFPFAALSPDTPHSKCIEIIEEYWWKDIYLGMRKVFYHQNRFAKEKGVSVANPIIVYVHESRILL